MGTLIVHLSDLHLHKGAEALVERATSIVQASLSQIQSLDAIHIVVSGDIANRGGEEEFEIALRFLEKLSSEFIASASLPPRVFVCAGNHDCDFSSDQSLREIVLKGVTGEAAGKLSGQVADALSAPLQRFYKFQKKVNADVEKLNAWCSTCEVEGSLPIKYVLINSSVCSSIKESPGKLVVPVGEINAEAKNRRVIFVMHHPLNWLQHDNARELAQLAASRADLFLFGHEHELTGQLSTDIYTGNGVAVMKGHVLFETANRAESAFQTIFLEPNSGFLARGYRWDGSKYVRWDERSTREYTPWCSGHGDGKLVLTLKAISSLDSVGANFTHRKKDHLTLQDIFVWPALRVLGLNGSDSSTEQGREVSAERLIEEPQECSELVLIRGEEQFGKSALARVLALTSWKKAYFPLLLSASQVSSWRERSLHDRIETLAVEFYGDNAKVDYLQLDRSQRVLVVDDFDVAQVTPGYIEGLAILCAFFGRVFVFVNEYPGVQVALSDFMSSGRLNFGRAFQILPCDLNRRLEIIERWLRVGDQDADAQHLRTTAAKLSKVVDETLGRNLIPSVPVFVLIILQRAELARDLDTVVKSGSHGFLYESLILHALTSKVSEAGVSSALTYLTSFARLLDSFGASSVSQTKFERFHTDHCARFDLDISVIALQRQLVDAEILFAQSGEVSFKYPFHYYYFTARALAQIEDWEVLERQIDALVAAIHTEKNANILLFLAHLGRNPKVSEKIIARASQMFADYEEADLFGELRVLSKFDPSSIRTIFYEGKRSDVVGELSRDAESAADASKEIEEMAEASQSKRLNDALSLNAAFKTLQVLGQVLRNHAGEIPAEEKLAIAKTCISLGLRVLGFVFVVLEEDGHAMIKGRIAKLEQDHAGISATEVQHKIQGYVTGLLADVSVGALLGVANAIGSEELSITIGKALQSTKSGEFLRLVTELEHFSNFPEKEVIAFGRDHLAGSGILPNMVFRRFIVRRFYLFPVRDELRRSVLSRFKIQALPFKFREQRKLELEKRAK